MSVVGSFFFESKAGTPPPPPSPRELIQVIKIKSFLPNIS